MPRGHKILGNKSSSSEKSSELAFVFHLLGRPGSPFAQVAFDGHVKVVTFPHLFPVLDSVRQFVMSCLGQKSNQKARKRGQEDHIIVCFVA